MKTEQRVINRVIKFRALVPVNSPGSKSMEYFDLSLIHDCTRLAYADYDASQLMQFTGLVDKEGNEIYEWDLVKDSAPWVWTVRFGEIISDGIRYVGWYLEHPEREDFSGPFTSEDTSVLKIVGNTFQGLLPSTTTI